MLRSDKSLSITHYIAVLIEGVEFGGITCGSVNSVLTAFVSHSVGHVEATKRDMLFFLLLRQSASREAIQGVSVFGSSAKVLPTYEVCRFVRRKLTLKAGRPSEHSNI